MCKRNCSGSFGSELLSLGPFFFRIEFLSRLECLLSLIVSVSIVSIVKHKHLLAQTCLLSQ